MVIRQMKAELIEIEGERYWRFVKWDKDNPDNDIHKTIPESDVCGEPTFDNFIQ